VFFLSIGVVFLLLCSSLFHFTQKEQVFAPAPSFFKKEKLAYSSFNSPPLQSQKRELESLERAFRMACYSVWVKGKEEKCLDADSPFFTWKFLRGYSKVSDLLTCSGSPTFSCSSPEKYGCFVLKRALLKDYLLGSQELNLKFNYEEVVSTVSYSDPCSAVGIFNP